MILASITTLKQSYHGVGLLQIRFQFWLEWINNYEGMKRNFLSGEKFQTYMVDLS